MGICVVFYSIVLRIVSCSLLDELDFYGVLEVLDRGVLMNFMDLMDQGY